MELPVEWISDSSVRILSEHWVNIAAIIFVAAIAYWGGLRLVNFIVHRAVKGGRNRKWHKKDIEKREKTLLDLMRTIWRIVVIATFGFALLNEFIPNVSTVLAPLFASAGIIGIAIGFGAQSLIKDFLSGIFIISENQYRVGDIVEIEGFSGTVERIGTRSTVLRDVDGNVHYFPNGMVQHVINKTLGFSMARFTINVQPETDIDKLTDLIDEVGEQLSTEDKWTDKIIEAPSFISLGEITGSSTEVIIAGKTQPSDQWAVTSEMRMRLHESFEKNNIKLAVAPTVIPTAPNRKK